MDESAPTIIRQDPDPLERLYADEHRAMVRLATLIVGSRAMAEEIVHEAFLAVSSRLDEVDRPGAYLRTTVVNGCRSALRRRETAESYLRSLDRSGTESIPEELIELRDALDVLSARQRVVVVLRYFVDLPDDEIAAVIDARPATVRSIAHRAMAVLREELR